MAADPPLMLMDEPFGAIDPINRDRLQNEFLRLQAEVKKTIVFVTHDIDEAIKMGDRVAVLRAGGKLAQYAPPSELLLHPADEFVEDFVGADRALKRLALLRVGDIPREALGTANGGPEIGLDTRLRDALSDLLGHGALHGRVIDGDGQAIGSLTVETLARLAAGEPA
jgi:osmoprotectant transport system ATP-binding protein